MKRFLTFLCCLLIAVASFAQSANQHLKFMGVPINGTIAQFQTKLVAKGCSLNKEGSAYSPNGCRVFNGTLIGNKVIIYAFYNTQTKIVYRVKAVIDGVAENIAEQHYQKLKNLLSQKYGSEYVREGTMNDKESLSFVSLRSDYSGDDFSSYSKASDFCLGTVDIFITKDDKEWIRDPYNYNVHIDYNDALNNEKNNSIMLEDL